MCNFYPYLHSDHLILSGKSSECSLNVFFLIITLFSISNFLQFSLQSISLCLCGSFLVAGILYCADICWLDVVLHLHKLAWFPSQFVCCQTKWSCRKDDVWMCVCVCVCVCVWCPPGDTGEVAEDILDLLLLQLLESREFWEDDDGAAVHPAAPWRYRGTKVFDTKVFVTLVIFSDSWGETHGVIKGQTREKDERFRFHAQFLNGGNRISNSCYLMNSLKIQSCICQME